MRQCCAFNQTRSQAAGSRLAPFFIGQTFLVYWPKIWATNREQSEPLQLASDADSLFPTLGAICPRRNVTKVEQTKGRCGEMLAAKQTSGLVARKIGICFGGN